MALSNLTDRNAIISAIKEFEELGRERFLAKYGYHPARSYFVLYAGGQYDSKAIVGVAHGIENPGLGPMQPSDFSGGESTVAKKVREFGFEVKSRAYKPRPPVFWALCGNPKRYRVADAVRELETDYWTIGRSDVRAGDQAVVWQTLDQGKRGVIAFAEIVGVCLL